MVKSHIPFSILSGFLGSGKTTLLNRILSENHGIRFAVLINEFGSIGLDASLLDGSQDFVEMDNGCLCCSLNEDLVETLEKLQARKDFDAVILETTGVADPLSIAWTFLREQFGETFRFDGIITVVDAANFFDMLDHASETKIQVERADFVYLSKLDLVEDQKLKKVTDSIQKLNPNARLVKQDNPDWLSLIFDFESNDTKILTELKEHVHDHSKHFSSCAIELKDKKVSLNDIEDFFMTLPKNVFRAKATFFDDTQKKYFAVHSVCNRVDFYEIPNFKGEQAVVFIGKDFDEEKLRQEFLKIFS